MKSRRTRTVTLSHQHQKTRTVFVRNVFESAPIFESLQSAAYYAMHNMADAAFYNAHANAHTNVHANTHTNAHAHDFALHDKFDHGKQPEHINAFELQAIATRHDPARLILRTLARLCGGIFIPRPTLPTDHHTRQEEIDALLDVMSTFGVMIEAHHAQQSDAAHPLPPHQFIQITGEQLIEALRRYLNHLNQINHFNTLHTPETAD